MTADPVTRGDRLAVVDGFRGIAILMVLLVHCFIPSATSVTSTLVYESLKWLWLGVDLFFVLSGFLITRILLASVGRPNYVRSFYVRRALRILPASYLVLLVTFLFFPVFKPDQADSGFQGLWPYFALYVQNWLLVAHPASLTWDGLHHTWSLAIEEQFYLAWPLLIRAIAPRWRELACLAGAGSAMALKILLWQLGFEWGTLFTATFTRADGLLLGAWLAVVSTQGHSRYLSNRAIDAIGLASQVALAALFFAFLGTLVSAAIVALVTPVAVTTFAYWLYKSFQRRHLFTPLLETRVLAWFARYSYGMYLIHWPLLQVLRECWWGKGLFAPLIETRTNWEFLVIGGAAAVATCLTAYAMFELVERRFLALKHRWPMPGL